MLCMAYHSTQDADPELYCLVEVSQIVKEGVKERPLNGREFPWQQMKDLRKVSQATEF